MYWYLLLFTAVLPSGSFGETYTLAEMVNLFERLEGANVSLGQESIMVANNKETQLKDTFTDISGLLKKHSKEAMKTMKVGFSCRTLRYTMAMSHFSSRILLQLKGIIAKLIPVSVSTIQKYAQSCAKTADAHKDNAMPKFEEEVPGQIKGIIADHLSQEALVNRKTGTYTRGLAESMYKGYAKGAAVQCAKAVADKVVQRVFNTIIDQEVDESIKVVEPVLEDPASFKKEARDAAKVAAMKLLQTHIDAVLGDIKKTLEEVHPWVYLFRAGMVSIIDDLNPESNKKLKLPSSASEEMSRHANWARDIYFTKCIGEDIDKETIYKPLGEIDLNIIKNETIPIKTLFEFQEKLKTKIIEETKILPEFWKERGPFDEL